MSKEIFVTKAYLPPRAEFDNYLSQIWDSAWLTNMGKLHEQLKREMAHYLGVDNIELFVNGHLALEMCLQAFDFPKGGEVITTPFSFASTTHAIVRQGLVPVFGDIRPKDCTLDPERIEELITDKTVAILPVHVYGNVCDVDAINKIAKKHGLKVIYDGAHAFGETLSDAGVGTCGDATMFSFHATKVYNTIEGGAVTWGGDDGCASSGDDTCATNNVNCAKSSCDDTKYETVQSSDGSGVKSHIAKASGFARRLYQLKNFGITGQEQVEYVGGNAKMNEFQAAMGLCNLKHIDELISARKERYEIYRDRLAKSDCKILIDETLDAVRNIKRNYAYLPVLFESEKRRNEVFDALAEHGIHARKYFYPCINEYDCYKNDYDVNKTPIAKDIASRVLTLPIYHDLEKEIIDEICYLITQ